MHRGWHEYIDEYIIRDPVCTSGNLFAADVLGSNGKTGAVYGGTTVSVPDGGTTLTLLGGALVGLGVLRRKFSA